MKILGNSFVNFFSSYWEDFYGDFSMNWFVYYIRNTIENYFEYFSEKSLESSLVITPMKIPSKISWEPLFVFFVEILLSISLENYFEKLLQQLLCIHDSCFWQFLQKFLEKLLFNRFGSSFRYSFGIFLEKPFGKLFTNSCCFFLISSGISLKYFSEIYLGIYLVILFEVLSNCLRSRQTQNDKKK